MRIQPEKLKPWADLLLTFVSLVAIPVTGWWAYHNFSLEDTHEANPNINVTAEVMPYDDERRLSEEPAQAGFRAHSRYGFPIVATVTRGSPIEAQRCGRAAYRNRRSPRLLWS